MDFRNHWLNWLTGSQSQNAFPEIVGFRLQSMDFKFFDKMELTLKRLEILSGVQWANTILILYFRTSEM